jgi:prepilin-type N-terminal cleavage/methylation domain-containing protein
MKHKTNKKGFTLIELLVVMSIIALLLSILMPALGRARAEAMLTKDQSQVKALYSGFSFWSPTHNGQFPIPGLQQRLEDPGTGQFIKGRGPENIEVNDHASMLSMCVMQNLFTPDILIAPTEQSEWVAPMEQYDYDVFDASSTTEPGIFWDQDFGNDLEGGDEAECNNSYGIMPLTGKRKPRNWKVGSSAFALIGTRGPKDGLNSKFSKSNLFHGISADWKGVITFGDGHLEVLETFYPDSTTYLDNDQMSVIDNIFKEDDNQLGSDDFGDGLGNFSDCILTHIKFGDITDDGTKAGTVNTDGFLHD